MHINIDLSPQSPEKCIGVEHMINAQTSKNISIIYNKNTHILQVYENEQKTFACNNIHTLIQYYTKRFPQYRINIRLIYKYKDIALCQITYYHASPLHILFHAINHPTEHLKHHTHIIHHPINRPEQYPSDIPIHSIMQTIITEQQNFLSFIDHHKNTQFLSFQLRHTMRNPHTPDICFTEGLSRIKKKNIMQPVSTIGVQVGGQSIYYLHQCPTNRYSPHARIQRITQRVLARIDQYQGASSLHQHMQRARQLQYILQHNQECFIEPMREHARLLSQYYPIQPQ